MLQQLASASYQIKPFIMLPYYAEACNEFEFGVPIYLSLRHSVNATKLSCVDAEAVANRLQCSVRFDWSETLRELNSRPLGTRCTRVNRSAFEAPPLQLLYANYLLSLRYIAEGYLTTHSILSFGVYVIQPV